MKHDFVVAFHVYDDNYYFDPGNWHYTQGLRMVAPGLVEKWTWNEETCGDICEGILGYSFLYKSHADVDQHALKIANWIDRYICAVYIFTWLADALFPTAFACVYRSPDQWTAFMVAHMAKSRVAP